MKGSVGLVVFSRLRRVTLGPKSKIAERYSKHCKDIVP